MSKRTLLVICALTFICGLIWVWSWHLTGLVTVLVIVAPIALAGLSLMWGE